jgi:hypothetical protein
MTRYLNIYPNYTGVTVYETHEAARDACGDNPDVRTIALYESLDFRKASTDSGLPCGIVACPKCGKVAAGYLAPDLECVCGYKFFERKEES